MIMLPSPAFWYRQDTAGRRLAKWALLPLAWLYAMLARKRFDLYFPVPMEKPVLCVGNLVAGGAGKTPVALALTNLLLARGHNPHLLTRGYGGRESGPLQVSTARDTAYDVGDEALLLAERAPTWVAVNRPLGAQCAMDSGASLIIMDDGFQNPVIYKNFSLIVIDGGVGFGNGQVMPAGPLREPLASGLARADAAVIVGEDRTDAAARIRALRDIPILSARLEPAASNPDLRGRKVAAFAGIGRPGKFKETLEAAGAEVISWTEFPDHFDYDAEDLQDILSAAEAAEALVITTAKDYVRVPEALRGRMLAFPVQLVWQDPVAVLALIESALQDVR